MLKALLTLPGDFRSSMQGSARVSLAAFRRNVFSDSCELLFEALFLYGIYLLTFNVFKEVRGVAVPTHVLKIFFWGYVVVDLSGALLFQTQIPSFVKSVKDQSVLFYQLSPGHPLLKLMVLRVSIPHVIALFVAFAHVLWLVAGLDETRSIPFTMALLAGIVMNALLELTFELSILNYDINLFGAFQNPISRLISRPLNAVLSAGSFALGFFKFAVPVYYVLGFAVEKGTGSSHCGLNDFNFLILLGWVILLFFVCNKLAKRLMSRSW